MYVSSILPICDYVCKNQPSEHTQKLSKIFNFVNSYLQNYLIQIYNNDTKFNNRGFNIYRDLKQNQRYSQFNGCMYFALTWFIFAYQVMTTIASQFLETTRFIVQITHNLNGPHVS